jgi:hypothetical protein
VLEVAIQDQPWLAVWALGKGEFLAMPEESVWDECLDLESEARSELHLQTRQ